jgi:hypothetical protein
MPKAHGNTDRIEKTIDISPEMIAAVEIGTTTSAPPAAVDKPQAAEQPAGETGEEAGEVASAIHPLPSTTVTPTPTITPEVDAEGSVIPRAIPVTNP